MINKLLNELKELREEKDYKNYRTLTDILTEHIVDRYFHQQTLVGNDAEQFHNIFSLIILEILELGLISNDALRDKDYGTLKIITQCYSTLQRLNVKYQYILKDLNCKE